MKKSLRIFALLCFLIARDLEAGEEIHTTRWEGEEFLFRILRREDSFKISLTGSGEGLEDLEPGISLKYGLLSAGSLSTRGILGGIDEPFSTSITSGLYDEDPGFRADFSIRPSSRYGMTISPFPGSGVALIREAESCGLWGWASLISSLTTRIEPFFLFSRSEFPSEKSLQEEYPFRLHSELLLYSGINLSLREPDAGFDLFISGQTSKTGRPGGFVRFRAYRNLELRDKTGIDWFLMGRRVFGGYTDFQGNFIEEEADVQLRVVHYRRWLEIMLRGELRRWKSSPVPQRYIPFERRCFSELTLGNDRIYAKGGFDLQVAVAAAGTNGVSSNKWLRMGIDLERFHCEAEYESVNDGGEEIEEFIQGIIGFKSTHFQLELRLSSDRCARMRLDIDPGAGVVDSAFFSIESSSTATVYPKIEISLGWSCSIETGIPR